MSFHDWLHLGGPTAQELRTDLANALHVQAPALPAYSFPAGDPMSLSGEEPHEGDELDYDRYPELLHEMRTGR